MLYRKNNAPKLSEELFLSPTAEYRAAPFWAWNGTPEKEQLMQQIDCLKRMGMGGFHIHSRTGLNKVSGIGSNSCGPELRKEYRLCEKHIQFAFSISPNQ